MSITVAQPYELLLISDYLKNSLGDINLKLLRKLSFCLAQERCYVMQEDSRLCGVLLMDRDFMGADRMVVLTATDDDKRRKLLMKAQQEARSSELFLVVPTGDALASLAKTAGFKPCGSLTLENLSSELPLIIGSSLDSESNRPRSYEVYSAQGSATLSK